MKKQKTKIFFIKNDVYPFDILVSIGETDEQFVKTVSKHLPSSVIEELDADPAILKFAATTLARTMMFDTGQLVIRMKNKPVTNRDQGIIAHEIFHAVEFLFRNLKMKLTSDTSEAYAYLIGHFTTSFYENL